VTIEELPLFSLLNTGLDTGTFFAESGMTRIKCTVFGFIKMDCTYSTTGLELEIEGGNPLELPLEETWLEPMEGGLCPEETYVGGTLESSQELHILQ
jgi:hypothetical protein